MIEIDNEFVVVCDIDDTLVMWNDEYKQPHAGAMAFLDPYDGSTNYLTPHQKHIDLLRKFKGRGMCVIIWSAAGTQWAKSVINTLGLADFVDVIMTKPSKYIDDLVRAEDILGSRIYLK